MKNEYKRVLELDSLHNLFECNNSYLDENDCSWYHSNWLVLRYLGMVSNPYWHEDFFKKSIEHYLNRQSSLLVLGTADFSMPLVCQTAGIENIEIIDICKTPLNICQNVSDYYNYGWKVTQSDVFRGLDSQYDAIVDDAFLTRFPYEKKRTVLQSIHDGLVDNGVYITTIRHEWNDGVALAPSEIEKTDFVIRATHAARENKFDAKQAESAATQYIEKMLSYPLKDREMLENYITGLFSIVYFEPFIVPGECKQTEYFRVVFRKE